MTLLQQEQHSLSLFLERFRDMEGGDSYTDKKRPSALLSSAAEVTSSLLGPTITTPTAEDTPTTANTAANTSNNINANQNTSNPDSNSTLTPPRSLGPNCSISPISTDELDLDIATPDTDLTDRRSSISKLLEDATLSSKEGDIWYLIPRDFLEDVLNLPVETFQELKEEVRIMDLTTIVDRNGNLYAETEEPVDTYNVPPNVFNTLNEWFGIRGVPISRALVYNADSGRKEVERFPAFFNIHTLQKGSGSNGITVGGRSSASHSHSHSHAGVYCSTTGTFIDLFEAIRVGFLKIPKKPATTFTFRIWFISTDTLPQAILISTFINDIAKKQLVLQNTYNQRLKDNGLTSPEYHILVEKEDATQGYPIDNYFKSMDIATHFDSRWILNNGGFLGLTNLGNTCYMNSALQCLLHVKEINDYFFFNTFEKELNKTNPLGYGGQIAVLFGQLLKRLFGITETTNSMTASTSTSKTFGSTGSGGAISPRDFKYTVGHHSSLFQGYQQQDSQEFLSWLLDALHEDLNRIYEKPYCEKPELGDDEVDDFGAIERLAVTCWNQHKQRNDLVITDIFTGMYKSTLVCPDCSKTSITFDPFNDVTLPLPVNKKWYHTFKFVNLDTSSTETEPQIKYGIHSLEVELSKTSNYDDLVKYVADHLSILPSNIFLFEIFNNFFYKDFQSNYNKLRYFPISEIISDHDDVVIYHIPHNPEKDIIIPVINTVADMDGSYNVVHAFGLPLFALFDAETEKTKILVQESLEEKVSLLVSKPGGEVDEDLDIDVEKVGTEEKIEENENSTAATPYFHIKYYMETKFIGSRSSNSIIHIPHNRANLNNLPDLFPSSEIHESRPSITASNSDPCDVHSDTVILSDNDEFIGGKSIEVPPAQVSAMISSNVTPLGLDVGEDDEDDEIIPDAEETEIDNNEDGFDTLGSLFDSVAALDTSTSIRSVSKASLSLASASLDDLRKMTLVCQWDHDQYLNYFTEDSSNFAWNEPAKIPNPAVDLSKNELSRKRNTTVSLYDCLSKFSSPEILGDQDLWYCPRCEEHKKATKAIQLWSTGDILTIHLKRFESARSFSDKIDMVVDFPIEGLDVLDFVKMDLNHTDNDNQSSIYDLIGVDNHYGGLGGGHYTAYAKNFRDNQWYYFNDSRVTPVRDPKESITGAAYLLFYRRRTSSGFGSGLGGERLQQLVEEGKQVFMNDLEISKGESFNIKQQIDSFSHNEEELAEAKRKLAEHRQKLQQVEEELKKDLAISRVQVTAKKSRSSIDPSDILNEDINIALMRKQRIITKNNQTIGIKPSLQEDTDESAIESDGNEEAKENSSLPSSSRSVDKEEELTHT